MRDATQRAELLRWCVIWLLSQGMEKINFALNIVDNRWLRDQISYIQTGPDGDAFEQQWGDNLDGVEDIFQRCYLQSLSLVILASSSDGTY